MYLAMSIDDQIAVSFYDPAGLPVCVGDTLVGKNSGQQYLVIRQEQGQIVLKPEYRATSLFLSPQLLRSSSIFKRQSAAS